MRLAPALVLALLLGVGAARAEPRDPAAAELHFKQGVAAAERADWEAACASFRESHSLEPAPGTLFRLADCEEHRGRVATAWSLFEDSAQQLGAADPRYAAVKARAAALEPRVPRLTVRIEPATPPEAVVKRDGVALGRPSIGVPLPVDPGAHEITVEAASRAPQRFPFRMIEGERSSIVVGAGAAMQRPVAVVGSDDGGAATRRTLGFVIGGVGVAGLLASGVLTLAMVGEHDTVEEHCSPDKQCDGDGLDAASAGRGLSTGATVAAVVGLAAVGAGVTLILTSGKSGSTTAVGARARGGSTTLTFARSFP